MEETSINMVHILFFFHFWQRAMPAATLRLNYTPEHRLCNKILEKISESFSGLISSLV
jgi:hypothetical protein